MKSRCDNCMENKTCLNCKKHDTSKLGSMEKPCEHFFAGECIRDPFNYSNTGIDLWEEIE